MTIAFDCDWTLRGDEDDPIYENIWLLQWFARHGDRIIIWSGGGADYAETIAKRLGLHRLAHAFEMKGVEASKKWGVDLCFDDCLVKLATLNYQVPHPTTRNDGPENWG